MAISKKTIGVLSALLISLAFSYMDLYSQTSDEIMYESAKKYFESGLGYYNNMQYLAAVEHFRKAVNTYPRFNRARDYLARSYKLAGHVDAAITELQNLAEMSPGNIIVNNRINTLNFQQSGYVPDNSLRVIPYKEYRSVNYKMYSFSRPVDIAVDNEKNLYVTSFVTGKLVKIDSNGVGIMTEKPGGGQKIYGIDYHNGMLAVTDFTNDRVMLLDKMLRTRLTFGSSGSAKGELRGPEGICFDSRGMLYVVDSGNNRIQKFRTDGSFIQSFGSKGAYENQFNNPTDITINGNTVYISDTGNRRISCYDVYGNFIKHILKGEVIKPRGLNIFKDNLVIADEKKGLLIYNLKNGHKKWISKWKDDNTAKSYISSTTDSDGNIYCLDYNSSTIRLYTSLQYRYSNLVVDITSVDLHAFPTVAFYVNVHNMHGGPVYGLSRENFYLTEDNANMTGIYTGYLAEKAPAVSMTFVVDRSPAGSEYTGQMKWVADVVLKQFTKNDRAKVINFHKDVWSGSQFDWSRRKALSAIEKGEPGKGKSIDAAIYSAVSQLVPRLTKRAVIVFTDGSVHEHSFSKYSPDILISYARNHFVPVYIVAFSKDNAELKRIAQESGGAYIRASNIDTVKELYGKVKKGEEYRYVLVYKSFKPETFKGLWTDVKLEVEYKGQKGVEWGGYFVP